MILLNGAPINITSFPDKTSQVWKNKTINSINDVVWKFESEDELVFLVQLGYILRDKRTVLHVDFLPYARQDKDISNETTFALIPFADVLNLCGFGEVVITDPHSERALVLIKNSVAKYPVFRLHETILNTKATVIIYPDRGAAIKYGPVYSSITEHVTVYQGEKTRDQLTGRITNYEINGNVKGEIVLIVDDICDGGATFVVLAKKLLLMEAKEVNLFVSHGIFSKGKEVLHEAGIKRIFTKDGEVN